MQQQGASVVRTSTLAAASAMQAARLMSTRVVKVPTLGDSVSSGTIEAWEKEVGDYVKVDEAIVQIETDKISVPVQAQEAGVLTEQFVAEGDDIEVGADLYAIDTSAEAPAEDAAAPAAEAAPAAAEESAPAAASEESAPAAAPAAAAPAKAATPPPPQASTPKMGTGAGRTETREKMTRMRQRIAERLKDAQNTAAMLTTFNEVRPGFSFFFFLFVCVRVCACVVSARSGWLDIVHPVLFLSHPLLLPPLFYLSRSCCHGTQVDMSNIMALRKKHQDAFVAKHGVKLGFMSAFVAASVAALEDQPVVNAVIEGNEIVYRNYVDVSVAVASPKVGLLVARGAVRMSGA